MSRRNDSVKHAMPSRRDFLNAGAKAGIACALLLSDENLRTLRGGSSARAQAPARRRFTIHITCGSWCGWSSGLLQPSDVGVYPKGAFVFGQGAASVNPNVNSHVKAGNLVFHEYSKAMLPHAMHMCTAVGAPLSLTHGEAEGIQSTGSPSVGAASNPGWSVGAAQAQILAGIQIPNDVAVIISAAGGAGVRISRATSNASILSAGTLPEFKARFADAPSVPAHASRGAFNDVLKAMHGRYFGPGGLPLSQAKAIQATLDSMDAGLVSVDPALASVQQSISRAKVDLLIDQIADAQAVKEEGGGYGGLLDALQLAAVAIETGTASGMAIGLDNQDTHSGGAAVQTARSAGQLWAQLSVFWSWVRLKGLQDDVLVIVNHEFARTASNGQEAKPVNVTFRDPASGTLSVKGVVAPGTDHHPCFGMVLLNGRLPGGARVGGVGDSFVAAGSRDLTGRPVAEVPAYTSVQIMGSVFLRVWPDLFPNQRVVRELWQNFGEPDVIPALLK